MLTGDKLSTARQIATSCNLISSDEDSTVLYVTNTEQQPIHDSLVNHLNFMRERDNQSDIMFGSSASIDRRMERMSDATYDFTSLVNFVLTLRQDISIIIEGKDLQVALDEYPVLFYEV
jgi:magnesium-transporting ATPase (P-type)